MFRKDLIVLFSYLNEKTMGRFIIETVATLINLHGILQQPLSDQAGEMSLNLLNPVEYAPFPPPLGDSVPN